MPRRIHLALNTADNYPLAYFLTFTTYGTWLHGDNRGSVDPAHAAFDSAVLEPNASREETIRAHLGHQPVILEASLRTAVEEAIRDRCRFRGWTLEALNVRTNHVHAVIAALVSPERILSQLKSRATRCCREEGLIGAEQPMWTRHGSTRYLWTEDDIERACSYVAESQGPDLPRTRAVRVTKEL